MKPTRNEALKAAQLAALKEAVNTVLRNSEQNIAQDFGQLSCILLKITYPQGPIIIKIETNRWLGKGTYAKVHAGYLVNQEDFTTSATPNFAIKIGTDNQAIQKSEIDILKSIPGIKLYFANLICEIDFRGYENNKTYVVMEYFPSRKLEAAHAGTEIPTRLKCIVSLCSQLQHLHRNHRTIHFDLKTDNVLYVNPYTITNKNKNKISVGDDLFLIDYGLAKSFPEYDILNNALKQCVTAAIPSEKRGYKRLSLAENYYFAEEDLDPNSSIDDLRDHVLINPGSLISPAYHAPETAEGLACLKSDIYSLCAIIASLLGSSGVYRNKMAQRRDAGFKQNFNIDIVNLGKILNIDLKKLVIKFLDHMQHPVFQCRPAIEFVLRFFTTLYRLYVHNKQMTLAQQQEALVTLIILADCSPELYRKKAILMQLLKPVTNFSGGPTISNKEILLDKANHPTGTEHVHYAPEMMLYQGIIDDYRKKNQGWSFW